MLNEELIILLVRVVFVFLMLMTGANVLAETIKAIATHAMP